MNRIFRGPRGPPSKSFHSKNLNDLEVIMQIIKIHNYYNEINRVPVDDQVYGEWEEMRREWDRLRKREAYHQCRVPNYAMDYFAAQGESIEDQLIREHESKCLYEAIMHLTPTEQRRVRMFMENMSYADIARAESCSQQASRMSVLKAFRKLRRLLEGRI